MISLVAIIKVAFINKNKIWIFKKIMKINEWFKLTVFKIIREYVSK